MRAELVSLLSRCAGLLPGAWLPADRTLAGMLFSKGAADPLGLFLFGVNYPFLWSILPMESRAL